MKKILYIGFGVSPVMSGGAILYQEWLAEEMSSRGYATACFFGIYSKKLKYSNKAYLKKWERNKVKYIMLHNSPNFPQHATPPGRQCSDPQVEKLLRRIIKEEKPDLIHIHELQMHTASVIDIAAELSIPCIKMIHNYYDVCPERDLMYKGVSPCLDYEAGGKCSACLSTLIERGVFSRKLAHTLYSIFVTPLPKWLFKPLSYIFHKIKKEEPQEIKTPEELAAVIAGQYSNRRKYFVERLNKTDIVQCSSTRSAEILEGCGVKKEKIKIIFPASKLADVINPKPLRNKNHPVVFGYIGGSQFAKGFNVLIEAFSKLDQTKAKLIIWSSKKETAVPSGLNIEIRGHYKTEDIEKVFNEIDVGVVPSVWEEAFGLIGIEWIKARIPVIGSRIGGIPEWLKDGENGYLFEPGNAAELAEKMNYFAENPENISKMQEKMKPWKSFTGHADEMEILYEALLKKRGLK
ncbi:MAG: hypothetical protein A2231_12265 [Candidatus Firestonebacteria bacterium RIFOXYA2_FULL_40_8]|nr:MAG: hypothetical protein A2231_12265 [Candidatus Firestonebacteria bacterium RIFOXYA2_FULL_40_8]